MKQLLTNLFFKGPIEWNLENKIKDLFPKHIII